MDTSDLELLEALVGDVLTEQCGADFAETVMWLHATAARVRKSEEGAAEMLLARLHALPEDDLEPIIRACSLQLQVANIAEERERLRRRRSYDALGTVQRESLAETADLLAKSAVDPACALADLHVELVLTAHPTEASRRSVLDHQWAITELLDRVEDPRTGRRAAGTARSSRCARSRGSSHGRRTGSCCRPGTARARRWPRRPRALSRDARALAVLRDAHLHAGDGAVQD